MKRLISFLLVLSLVLALPMFAMAEITGDPLIEVKGPIMITNAGQGPGGKMGRLLVSRCGTLVEEEDFFYVDVPYAADFDVRDYGAVVIVIGSTDKGLGATGITIDEEIARINEVVATANEKNVPIIACLLEKDKRSDIPTNANERCIDAVCPTSAWMIVVADGNTDNRFDAIKDEFGVPLTILGSSKDFLDLVKTSFVK